MRETTFRIAQELAAPLVEQGLARLEVTEPDPDDEWLSDGAVELVPSNAAAASVEVIPAPALVVLLVGPDGNGHEVVVDKDGQWQLELRACLKAVIDGRYRESAVRGRVSRQVLTMTFELPAEDDIVVRHHDMTEPDSDEEAKVPRERRFAGYAS